MKVAITSIQRDRNPYIVEWIAFHLAMGFNQFYIYCHKTTDGMTETLQKLSKRYSIQVISLYDDDSPQILAYRHAWANFGKLVDWMAFIDGDEFLFPTKHGSIQEALAAYNHAPISALGVYWKCYGSNGHITEPAGLILENYPKHSRANFAPNQHIKSIARGGAKVDPHRSHLFQTELGTFDEHLRPITFGYMADYVPTYEVFRINHYVVQSKQYFQKTKQGIGAADLPRGNGLRTDEWFTLHDTNDEDDGVAKTFLPKLKEKMIELEQYLETPHRSHSNDESDPRVIVMNYHLAADIPDGNHHSLGNSVGLKEIVGHIVPDKARAVSILEIGFGSGDLGLIVKTNPELCHWHVDGIDGFLDACCNIDLFNKRLYRNIWHGLAQDLPLNVLHSYDLICLFDVIEHLDSIAAKKLLSDLLNALNPNAYLVLSTSLWLCPEAHQNPDDLTAHKTGIPAQSLLALSPVAYHIHSKYLVGTFVYSRQSIIFLNNFSPTTDPHFNFNFGLKNLHLLGIKADDILYFVTK